MDENMPVVSEFGATQLSVLSVMHVMLLNLAARKSIEIVAQTVSVWEGYARADSQNHIPL